MAKQKLIDNTQFKLGAAERYLTFSADFKKWLRNKYKVSEIKAVDITKICKMYHLKGIVFGNYVTQEERYFFLFKISKQLEFLAKIKGSKNLGADVLVIGFGAAGKPKSLAYYNPQEHYINLNRGRKSHYSEMLAGENSFIHEYGHFLDFIQGRADKTQPHNFASEVFEPHHMTNSLTEAHAALRTIAGKDEEYMDSLDQFSNSKYLRKPIEVFARMFEATITHLVHEKYPAFVPYFDDRYKGKIYLSKARILKSSAFRWVKIIVRGK